MLSIDHTEHDWTNHGKDAYIHHLGKEAYEEREAQQFQLPDISDPKTAEHYLTKMKLMINKAESLFVSRALTAAKVPENGDMHRTGGFGFAEVIKCDGFEEVEFFRPGRMFKVNVCHGNLLNTDDASIDVRVAFLKLHDPDSDETFDLVMQTGRTNMFYNLATYSKFVERVPENDLKGWALQSPANLHNLIGALRMHPDSYGSLSYYCHATYKMTTKSGEVKLVRFRYYPMEEKHDGSLLSYHHQMNPWITKRCRHNRKNKNYLRKKYLHDVIQNEVRCLLQVQVHNPLDTEVEDLYNTGVEWNLPWLSIATVTITTPLTDLAASKLVFNVNTHPAHFSLPTPTSIFDFKSFPTALAQFCDASNQFNAKNPPKKDHDVLYVIVFKVADVEEAGTDADVMVTLYGRSGKTSPKKLGRMFNSDFERGALETYHFTAEDVGVPLAIQVTLKKKWFNRIGATMKIDYINVLNTYQQCSAYFPFYSVVTDECIIPKSSAATPQQASFEFMRQLRKFEIRCQKDTFQWKLHPQLHGGIQAGDHDSLPISMQLDKDDIKVSLFNAIASKLSCIARPLGKFRTFESLGDYLSFAQSCNPEKSDTYKELFDKLFVDAEFGRQFLNGADPTVIERCTNLPENFNVTNEMVGDLMQRGVTLEEEMRSGHVYIVNFKHFCGIPGYNKKGTKRYVAAPMALLYVNAEKELVPIAIQFNQEDCEHVPIWTPKDGSEDWLFAKMWVRNAATQHHQLYTIFTRTLFTLEAVTVALERNLYISHPVYKLLMPTLKTAVANAVIERKNLLGDDGLADRTMSVGSAGALAYMRRCFKHFNIYSLFPSYDAKSRGVLCDRALPNYHWRHDSLGTWGIIHDWVKDFLEKFYHSDEAVLEDNEIQDWMRDLEHNGLPTWFKEDTHMVPEKCTTLEQLVNFVALFFYTATFGYASLNFPRSEYDVFIPNSPAAMLVPPPTSKGKTTMETIIKALPRENMAMDRITYVLSRTQLDESKPTMDQYHNHFYTGASRKAQFDKLLRRLYDLDVFIDVQNKEREPYHYFQPDNVPVTISI